MMGKSLVALVMLSVASCTQAADKKASLPADNPALKIKDTSSGASVPSSEAASQALTRPAEGQIDKALQSPSQMAQKIQGQVIPMEKAALGFKVPGFIESIHVKPGQRIKKGEPLAKLDATDYKLNVQFAESKKRKEDVTVRGLERDFGREDGLRKANATTDAAYEKVLNALEAARAMAQLASVDVIKSKEALQDAVLVAPYDCLVTKQLKYAGEYAGVGAPIFELQMAEAPEIILNVPERFVKVLKVGDQVSITVPAIGYKGSARISRMVDVVSEKTRTFEVYLAVTDPALTTGLFVEAEFQ